MSGAEANAPRVRDGLRGDAPAFARPGVGEGVEARLAVAAASVLPQPEDGAPAGCCVRVGVGVDLVHVPSFAAQLDAPGSVFTEVFTDRERDYCQGLSGASASDGRTRRAASFAARWAAKEAAVKAWSSLIAGEAPAIRESDLVWSDIEAVHDRWSRPLLRFRGEVHSQLDRLASRLGVDLVWSASLSHDGDYALALVTCHALATLD